MGEKHNNIAYLQFVQISLVSEFPWEMQLWISTAIYNKRPENKTASSASQHLLSQMAKLYNLYKHLALIDLYNIWYKILLLKISLLTSKANIPEVLFWEALPPQTSFYAVKIVFIIWFLWNPTLTSISVYLTWVLKL